MPVKLKSGILEKVSRSDLRKLWAFFFRRCKRTPNIDSISLVVHEHDFGVALGENGGFEPNMNEFQVEFKEVFDEWLDKKVEAIEDVDAFADEVERIRTECKNWYFGWVKSSFEFPEIKRLKKSILANRPIGIWKCLSVSDYEAGKHRWLVGDSSVALKKRKLALPPDPPIKKRVPTKRFPKKKS